MPRLSHETPTNRSTEQHRWQVGDRAVKAQRGGPHGLSEYAKRSGQNPTTLRRWARVARAYPSHRRAFPGLKFSHYEAAAGRSARFELLGQASRERWSVSRLKRELAATQKAAPSDGVRRLTPAVLDDALTYCDHLKAGTGDSPDRLGAPVRDRLTRLAVSAGALAGVPSEECG